MKRILFIAKNWGYGYGMAVQYLGEAFKFLGNSVLVGEIQDGMKPVDLIINSEYPGLTAPEQVNKYKKAAPTYLNTDFESYPLPKEFFEALDIYDGVIVHSNYEKDLYRLSGATQEQLSKVHIIPNPVKYDLNNLTRDNYRESLGVGNDVYVVGVIGAPTVRKGFVEDFIVYMNAFKDVDPAKVLLVFRPTPYAMFVEQGKQIFAMIKSLKIMGKSKLNVKIISDTDFDTIKFYNSLNAILSLHHSEGYGLHLAEASLLNKQIIATNYSGNMDFMAPETAYLVPSVPSYNTDPYGAYNPSQIWADPILPDGVEQLKKAYQDFIAGTPKSNKNFYQQCYMDTLTQISDFINSKNTRADKVLTDGKVLYIKDKLIEV